jgi:hypothetical protein
MEILSICKPSAFLTPDAWVFRNRLEFPTLQPKQDNQLQYYHIQIHLKAPQLMALFQIYRQIAPSPTHRYSVSPTYAAGIHPPSSHFRSA